MDRKYSVTVVIYCIVMFGLIFLSPLMRHDKNVEQQHSPQLIFHMDEHSFADRGYGQYSQGNSYAEAPIYRYQNEGWGTCLYLYDNCGTLKGRIVNPAKVEVIR